MLLTPLRCYIVLPRALHRLARTCPPTGPVILAPNHFSFMDHFFVGAFIRGARCSSWPSRSCSAARCSSIYTHGGVFPVRRGARDEEAFITAETVLARGGMRASCTARAAARAPASSRSGASPGIGRLALESGAPVVPVAIHGS